MVRRVVQHWIDVHRVHGMEVVARGKRTRLVERPQRLLEKAPVRRRARRSRGLATRGLGDALSWPDTF
jgi:hypothetical protein